MGWVILGWMLFCRYFFIYDQLNFCRSLFTLVGLLDPQNEALESSTGHEYCKSVTASSKPMQYIFGLEDTAYELQWLVHVYKRIDDVDYSGFCYCYHSFSNKTPQQEDT